jgi:hypothetical protein
MSRISRHLTYSNVMATIAVFLVLGGGAYATFHLPKNSVRSKNIVNGQVRGQDVKESTLKGVNAKTIGGKRIFSTNLVTVPAPASATDPPNSKTLFKDGSIAVSGRCRWSDPTTLVGTAVASTSESDITLILDDLRIHDPNGPEHALAPAVAIDTDQPDDRPSDNSGDFLLFTPSGNSLAGIAVATADKDGGSCSVRVSAFG